MKKSNPSPRHPYSKRIKFVSSIAMKIGLIVALSLTIFAFNWTTYPPPPMEMVLKDVDELKEVKMIRTVHKKKRVPPPTIVKPSTETIIDEPDFDPEPQPKLIEKAIVVDDPADVTPDLPVARVVVNVPPPPAPIVVDDTPEVKVFDRVEEMPRFNGCEGIDGGKNEKRMCAEKKLLEYMYSKIKYPTVARTNDVEGLVVVQFVVAKDGSIVDVKILKDIGAGCGKETVRVAKGMPKWIPGKQRGKEVSVRFNLPVQFKLR